MAFRDLLRNFGSAFRPKNAAITTSRELYDQVVTQFYGAAPIDAGEVVNYSTAQSLGAVYACVFLTSRVIASVDFELQAVKSGKSGRKVYTSLVDDPLYALLMHQPNEWQSAFEWKMMMQRDWELRGNAYAFKVVGIGGNVTELIRLHPDCVQAKQDDRLAVTYEYTKPNGTRVTLTQNQVLHLRHMSDDGVTGMSPIMVHRQSIGDALAVRRHGSRFFGNGAKPLGMISFTGAMADEDKDAFRKDWEDTYAGGGNAYRTLLLPEGMTYTPVAITNQEAEYIESKKLGVTEIARIFGVPPHKIADLDRSTNNNIEHQGIEFVSDSIRPRWKMWRGALQRDILAGDSSRVFSCSLEDLMRGDAKSRAEALQIERQNGVINANEWRAMNGLNDRDDKGGEEYIVATNMRIQDGTKPPVAGAPAPQKDPPAAA